MKPVGRYDSGLQMFVQDPLNPKIRNLEFLRHEAEQGRLEHGVNGQTAGEHATLRHKIRSQGSIRIRDFIQESPIMLEGKSLEEVAGEIALARYTPISQGKERG